MRRYRVELELTREVASGLGRGLGYRVPFYAMESIDYFPLRLSWRIFKLGASDYDIIADEAYCPCGVTVGPEEGSSAFLGEFVEACNDHIAEAHPGVIR
jgi:hypothetical protein